MPAHKQKIPYSSSFIVTQNIFKYFIEKGFVVFPEIKTVNSDSFERFERILIISETPTVSEKISDIPVAFGTSKDILMIIKTTLEAIKKRNQIEKDFDITCEWNYLGKTEEKRNYFEYLSRYYWQNQDKLEILSLAQNQEILENNWKITTFSDKFEENIKLPIEFFNPETANLLDKLSNLLPQWELNPYLIFDGEANLQWQIKVIGNYKICGSISKVGDKLFHKISLPSLT
jgi:hypothetical protein